MALFCKVKEHSGAESVRVPEKYAAATGTRKGQSISNTRPSRCAQDDTPTSALFDAQNVLFEMDCPQGVCYMCRLTDKFTEKGSYASEGENGDFMCQSCQCKQAMIYLTTIVRGSIIIV